MASKASPGRFCRNVGQNLITAATPATTGATSAVFTLTPGALSTGTAEPGFEGFVDDDFINSNIDFTRDLGLRSASGTGFLLSIRERTVLETTAVWKTETFIRTSSNRLSILRPQWSW